MSIPLVSICIRSYNQDKYISEAIEGALMQKTSFPFEIIIGEDCSTDRTPQILAEYKSDYPDKIRIVTSDSNVGGRINLKRIIEASNAKYIALCDGDDYWTDPYKLQKQVNFLESHNKYVLCFHNVINCWENIKNKPSLFNPLDFPEYHNYKSLVERDWFLPINSEVFVREKLFFPDWYANVMNDDYVINLVLAMSGPFYYMPDLMAVYRHNQNSESNNYSDRILLNENFIYIFENIRKIYPIESQNVFDRRIDNLKNEIERIKFNKKYPIIKYLRCRTYKKIIKRLLVDKMSK